MFHVVCFQLKETSSMRALPNVHEALRQNDPSMATGSQPVLKKAPPSTGRGMPKVFYSDKEPPRIGSAPVQPPPPSRPRPWEVQPQGVSLPQTPTPTTPGHPPRPPVEALPKPMPMESQMTHKHPVESSSQQGPPRQARHKPFPFNQPPPVSTSMLSPAAVEAGCSHPQRSSSIIHANSSRGTADVFQLTSR